MTSPLTPLLLGFLVAFLLCALPGKWAIGALRKLGAKQNVSLDAPAAHSAKQGTPTMGGLLILFSVMVCGWGYLLISRPAQAPDSHLFAVLLMMLFFGGIGFLDDYLSIKRGKNLGLRAREKMLAQLLLAVLFCVYLAKTSQPGWTTALSFALPGGEKIVDIGVFYYLFLVLLIVGFSNATNFTDGVDGLSSGVILLIALTIAVVTFALAPGIAFFCVALAGALTGFLWWNAHPAKMFMGDTGSLALGAGLACAAAVGKREIPLIIASLVCWAELLSVILQVAVFQYRKKTKGLEFAKANRLFRRAPLHHHFEEAGWKETLVVARFWIAGAICSVLALLWRV